MYDFGTGSWQRSLICSWLCARQMTSFWATCARREKVEVDRERKLSDYLNRYTYKRNNGIKLDGVRSERTRSEKARHKQPLFFSRCRPMDINVVVVYVHRSPCPLINCLSFIHDHHTGMKSAWIGWRDSCFLFLFSFSRFDLERIVFPAINST